MEHMAAPTDELYACKLLRNHLAEQLGLEFACELNPNDPPDLIATLADGRRLGVEVVRGYQQVARFNTGERVPTVARGAILERFAMELERKTAGKRKLSYFLSLGPGAWESPDSRRRLFDDHWKKEAEESILNHIWSASADTLKLPGVWLKPGGSGNAWTIGVSAGADNTACAVAALLATALSSKACKADTWKGDYVERWLLILSQYPLAQDPKEVRSIAIQLVQEHPEWARFEGILWSPHGGLSLVRMELPKT